VESGGGSVGEPVPVTAIAALPLFVPRLAVIVAAPAFTPVIRPDEDTVATRVSLELQLTRE
jgi:hypothetical protein